MAVVSIKELHQRRRSAYRDGKYTHTRVFLVITNDINDGTAVAITAAIMDGETVVAAIPAPYELYPGSLLLRVVGKEAQPVQESGLHFEVTVEYAIPDTQENTENPLNAPAEISWGAAEGTEPYFKDITGKAVVNSAGEAFDQFLERDRSDLVITITRNEASFNAVAADAYRHTTNQNPVNICGVTYAAGTLKMSPIQATRQTATITVNSVEQTIAYARVTYTMRARAEGWDQPCLDVGLNEYIADEDPTKPGKLKPIVDSVGTKVAKPWPLDGQGRKRPKPTDGPAEISFKPYGAMNWTPLAFA